MQPHLFPCASSSAAASFPALICTVKLFTAPGPFWKKAAILKINKINKTNQSQQDCPCLPQIQISGGRLCNPTSFGAHQLMLAPLWMFPGSWGCPDWGALLTAMLLPGASGAPHEQRWWELTLLSCLGGYIGDGVAVGGFGLCPWLAKCGCRAPSSKVCWELSISKGKYRLKR